MTDEVPPPLSRVSTHVPGLDPLLEGGFLVGGVYIIEGTPGAGKTLLGSQFCFGHASAGGRALYVTLLSESHTRLAQHLRRMEFFDAHLIPDGVYYLSGFKVLEGEGLEGLLRVLRQTLSQRKASALVLDGLVSAEEASPNAKEFKKFIHELQTITAMQGCTALLLNSTERSKGFRPELTMVDGILELTDDLLSLRPARHLRVRKMRGTAPVRGVHTLDISDAGIRVIPRAETTLGALRPSVPLARINARVPFGIPTIDAMLRGGLPACSMTALIGPSGSGKTLCGLHFLSEGVLHNEPGVLFGFYETPQFIREKSKRIGLDLAEAEQAGVLQLLWQSPLENMVDVLVDRLVTAVRRIKARRLVIDGLQAIQLAAETPDRARRVLAGLREELDSLGVTTLYTIEVPNLLSWDIELSASGVSAVTDNLLVLRHVELGSKMSRLFLVAKVRDSQHDEAVRAFHITDRGIVVGDVFTPPDSATPPRRLRSRAPASGVAKPSRKKRRKPSPKRKA